MDHIDHDFHIAQFNLARARAPLSDPLMRGFTSQLLRINRLADHSPGFVWRLQTEDGDATTIRAYPEDESLLLTLSVWESVEDLVEFSYRGEHAAVMRDREMWFHHIEEAYIVLWWVRAGHIPSLEESKERLAFLRQHGPTPKAFTFKVRFSPQEALGFSGQAEETVASDRRPLGV
jgi:hypothetical protein